LVCRTRECGRGEYCVVGDLIVRGEGGLLCFFALELVRRWERTVCKCVEFGVVC
jgi:hypothetical protein